VNLASEGEGFALNRMDHAAPADAEADRKKGHWRIGVSGLIVVLGLLGLISWAGLTVWRTLNEDDSFLLLGSGDAAERSLGVRKLGQSIDKKSRDFDRALVALIHALGDSRPVYGGLFDQLARQPVGGSPDNPAYARREETAQGTRGCGGTRVGGGSV
jgi:hypothetical protein